MVSDTELRGCFAGVVDDAVARRLVELRVENDRLRGLLEEVAAGLTVLLHEREKPYAEVVMSEDTFDALWEFRK